VVYQRADGIYVRAGLEKDKTVLLVLIGVLMNGKRYCWPVRAVIGRARNLERDFCVL